MRFASLPGNFGVVLWDVRLDQLDSGTLDELREVWLAHHGLIVFPQPAVGDLVVSDKLTIMQRRDPFPPCERRLMHRMRIKATVAPAAWA